MKNQIFEYGGFHFIPERKFTVQERDFFKISRRQRIDRNLGFCIPGYIYESHYAYSHESFYVASPDKECDLFRCVENGKLYLPCELTNTEKQENCPKCSESSILFNNYKDFYEDITALHDCNDCGIKGICKFSPEPGQMVRINCPLWVEK